MTEVSEFIQNICICSKTPCKNGDWTFGSAKKCDSENQV